MLLRSFSYLFNTRGIASPTIKRELRRRSAVGPIIACLAERRQREALLAPPRPYRPPTHHSRRSCDNLDVDARPRCAWARDGGAITRRLLFARVDERCSSGPACYSRQWRTKHIWRPPPSNRLPIFRPGWGARFHAGGICRPGDHRPPELQRCHRRLPSRRAHQRSSATSSPRLDLWPPMTFEGHRRRIGQPSAFHGDCQTVPLQTALFWYRK